MTPGPLRFIHTADWHLGRRHAQLPGDTGALLRAARVEAIATLGRLAAEHGAQFVVAAGDSFDAHDVAPATVRNALEALRACPVPVYILPGNHDPDLPAGIYRSALWQRNCPPHVQLLSEPRPYEVAQGPGGQAAYLLPAPWGEHHALVDPCAHLRADLGPAEGFRIGVAHGGVREIVERLRGAEHAPGPHTIPSDLAARARLDYLALGDWHSRLEIGPRTWYSGSPEPTSFAEAGAGFALLVEIEQPGAEPRVRPLRVARYCWLRREATIAGVDDVAALEHALGAIDDKRHTLLELTLEGTVSLGVRAALERRVLEPARESFALLRLRDEGLLDQPTEADFELFANAHAGGWLEQALEQLRQQAHSDRVAARALALLYRLHAESQR